MDEITKGEKVKKLLEAINLVKDIGRELGYENILYNEQYKELEIATILGHEYNEGQGEDAKENDEDCEYKTMLGTDGSFQYHWISKNKLEKLRNTPHHYFATYSRENFKVDKIYYLPVDRIIGEIEAVYLQAESKRQILNESSTTQKQKNIDAHKSFSLSKIIRLGATLVYENK